MLNFLKYHRRDFWLYLINAGLSLTIGIVVFQWDYSQSLRDVDNEHAAIIAGLSSSFSQEMGDITNIVRLANEHLIDTLDTKNQDYKTVSATFLRIGRVLNHVSQIRWLNKSGQEVVRVNFHAKDAQIVPEAQLQDKSQRDYFRQAKQTASGEITLSPVDLNVEEGELVYPLEPTLRTLLHTFPSHPLGEGFLVLNFDLRPLLARLATYETMHTEVLFASGSKEWMVNPDKQQEWQHSLRRADGIVLPDSELAGRIFTNEAISLTADNTNTLYSSAKLKLRMKLASTDEVYFAITRTPGFFHEIVIKQALIPSTIAFVATFALLSLLIIRDGKQQNHLMLLNQQLANEKGDLKEALSKQSLLRDELVEAEKMASLGMLVAGVAHEMSTPVGGAIMCVSSLKNRLEQLEDNIATGLTRSELDNFVVYSKESLQLSASNLERASELIKRFKRLAVDRGSETPVFFNLHQVAVDLVRTLERQASAQRVQIVLNIPEDIKLCSYPGLYSQILQNLITNALDHAFGGRNKGEVVVTASSGSLTVIKVKDNGVGIAEDIHQTIFEPFVTTARSKGNTGLGMHLVHQWVTKLLGGQIKFESVRGEGTTFTITFPVSSPPKPSPVDI